MCLDKPLVESTKLNRFTEKMPSKYIDDAMTSEDHSFIKKIVEESGDMGLCYLADFLFCPLRNFHTSEYTSIQNKWG